MDFTGERMVLGETDIELEIEHLNRYHFAEQLVGGKKVLDAACGTGYGSAIMAKSAECVFGIDISQEAVDYANETYSDEKIKFVQGSVDELPFENEEFDVVVSFETIEHINGAQQNLFLKEIKRTLKKDGVLLISSPNHSVYKKRGENHFHIKELDYLEFKLLLETKFKNVKFFSQQFEICNAIVTDQDSMGEFNRIRRFEDAEYLIAICSDGELPELKSRAFVRDDNELEKLMDWAISTDKLNLQKDEHIKILDTEIAELRKSISEVGFLKSELESKSLEQDAIIGEKELKLAELESKSLEQDAVIKEKELKLAEIENRLSDAEVQLVNKEGHINQLLEVDREFTNIKNSRAWKMMNIMWKASSVLLPHGSKRRLAVKVCYKFVRYPGAFLRKLSPDRVKKFFYYLRREGVSGVSRRLDDSIKGTKIEAEKIEIIVPEKAEKKFEEYEKLNVPQFESPEVSIVIPVYNQFEFTYNCIRSIIENSEAATYEIIIANDCSNDLTTRIEEIISGITVITNEKNLRFLLNCNNAAQYANGKYILFLNNDTQVQKNWLNPLIELIQRDEKIGMVGSKLVYPDGRLQEAGGILWNDGSAWNYGHLADANDPEYNYVKEADYISGAAVMIKKNLWEEIGGFDERFIPAYCEDSDLAFEVRKRGYKVMYQPLSVVVHFEGISNGTDTSSGQKQYQVVNSQKFFEKWKDVLEKESFLNAENVFVARDRSRNKKTVVVVDHYVPTFDKDAGSRTVYQYIKLFVEKGFNVKLIGDNFYQSQPYTTVFQQMGVEVLYGSYYANNWKRWIKENSKYFDFFFLNRPHISVKYIDFVREHTSAKVMYYGHDLHFLREFREYELTGDLICKKNSEDWKKKELSLMKKADYVYYPSAVEENTIKEIDSSINVKAIPAYIFEDMKPIKYNTSERKDLMFIGGFNHKPNVDGVLWFINEIMPYLTEKLPDIKIHILGSNTPEEVKMKAGRNIIIEGFVTDEQLADFYKNCRMSIVPLRYGAGIKGKVVEAMKNGMPVVTTAIGAEGILGAENILRIEDDEKNFAQAIVDLYDDEERLEFMSQKSEEYISKNFSSESVINVIGKDFSI